MGQLLERGARLKFHGVLQGDPAPRNMLINYHKQSPARIEAFWIDFSHSFVQDLPNSQWVTVEAFRRDRPDCPFGSSWRTGSGQYEQWIPKEYREPGKLFQWFTDRWGNSDEFEPFEEDEVYFQNSSPSDEE